MSAPTQPYVHTYSHRTLLELSVGTTHTVECLVHMRRSDLEWFNAPDRVSDHQRQLFGLIGRRILPQERGEEIEADLSGWRQRRAKIGVLIGETNIAEAAAAVKTAATAAAAAKAGAKKRGGASGTTGGRGGKTRAGKKGGGGKKAGSRSTAGGIGAKGVKSGSKTSLAAHVGGVGGKKVKRKRNTGDISYLFGETLQVTYRAEEIKTSDSVTLLYTNTSEGTAGGDGGGKDKRKRSADTELATFRTLKKLSKRIIIWVYPFDSANPTAPNPEGGGFPRPEMMPLTSLFVER